MLLVGVLVQFCVAVCRAHLLLVLVELLLSVLCDGTDLRRPLPWTKVQEQGQYPCTIVIWLSKCHCLKHRVSHLRVYGVANSFL